MVNGGAPMLAFAKSLLPETILSAVAACTPGKAMHSRGAAPGSRFWVQLSHSTEGETGRRRRRLTANLWTQETAQMATARTETTPTRKAAAAGEKAAETVQKNADTTAEAGTILAERYRDAAYQALAGKNGEHVSAVMSASEAMFNGLAEMHQEMMDFAGARLRADMEGAEDFTKANSPEDLFEKQCSFARRASQHYAEETSKLIGMMARIQQSCWAPMEECTKQALHGLNSAEDDDKKK